MDREMGGRGMRGMFEDGRGRGYDAMVVAEAIGRLGRGELLTGCKLQHVCSYSMSVVKILLTL